MRVLFALLALLSIINGCQAQASTQTVYVQDSVHTGPWGYFSVDHFVGLKLNSSGYATVYFLGGDEAFWQYRVSYSDEWQGAVMYPNELQHVYITQTGTYWVYLAEDGSVSNYDWIEIRIVANSFTGTITPIYGTAPSAWYYGWPPMGQHMIVSDQPTPASRPGPISIRSWLIPLLVVIIVLAIAIPSTIYFVRRHKAKKLAALGSQVEQQEPEQVQSINMDQMNQAVRV
jgi:hypothetical protein